MKWNTSTVLKKIKDDEDPFVGKSEYILSEDWDFVVE